MLHVEVSALALIWIKVKEKLIVNKLLQRLDVIVEREHYVDECKIESFVCEVCIDVGLVFARHIGLHPHARGAAGGILALKQFQLEEVHVCSVVVPSQLIGI